MWENVEGERFWEELLKLINAPLNLEAALRSLQQIENPQLLQEAPSEDISPED